jgi:hypothetical protein
MNDRSLFIQDEIACSMVDDFCVLPYTPIVGRVVKPVSAAYERHIALFAYTH